MKKPLRWLTFSEMRPRTRSGFRAASIHSGEASAVAAFDIEGADAQGVDDRQGALVVVVARVQLDAPRVGRIRRLPGAPG